MTDPQPLTGDELATIKARAEAPACRDSSGSRPLRCGDLDLHGAFHCPECTSARHLLRLVAEIERLQGLPDMTLGWDSSRGVLVFTDVDAARRVTLREWIDGP